MKNYGKMRSSQYPAGMEFTDNNVFVASNIEAYEKNFEGTIIKGYEYDYISYTKDEFLMLQNQKVTALEEELAAAKIILGVD